METYSKRLSRPRVTSNTLPLLQRRCVSGTTARHSVQLVPGVELSTRVDRISTGSLDVRVVVTQSCSSANTARTFPLEVLTTLSFGVEKQVVTCHHVTFAVWANFPESCRGVFEGVDWSKRKTLNNTASHILCNGRDGVVGGKQTVQLRDDTIVSVFHSLLQKSRIRQLTNQPLYPSCRLGS
jgi:hypothetical protein